MTTIVRAVQTLDSCPSEWDAWDSEGNYWYLHYRFGWCTAERQPGPDTDTWSESPPALSFNMSAERGEYDGEIDLEDFCELAGIELHLT
jgi:hypothetical protein